MRPIACTDAAGKLFWTLINDRLRSFWTTNNYLSSSQKGALNDTAGCLEHTWTLFEAIKDAKLNKRQLVISWLDLKNAYGSIRHNLIQFALKWYHVPEWVANLIFQYYEQLHAFVIDPDWKTKLFPFLIGVFQGCVISPTLFIGVFQIILDFIDQKGVQPYVFKQESPDGKKLSLLQQAYVDDHTLVNSSVDGANYNIRQLRIVLEWSRCLVIKVPKCYTLAFADRRWKEGDEKGLSFGPFDPKIVFGSETLKFIGEESFKFLGRKTWASKSTKKALECTFKSFESDLSLIDKVPVSGASKVWLYQFKAVARLVWPFLIYPFSPHGVSPFDTLATKLIKKWYGINRPANPTFLYLPNSKKACGWNLTSPGQLLKSIQIVGQHILKHSRDNLTNTLAELSRNKAKSSKARQWSPGVALDELESIISFNIAFGGRCDNKKLGLGADHSTNLKNASLREKRQAISALCKSEVADARLINLRDLALSGNFLKWDNLMSTQLDWNNQILGMSPKELSFVANGQALALPDPSNLRRWGFNKLAVCPLCNKRGATTAHILNGCYVALKDDRYTWRHDNVLKAIFPDLKGTVASANRQEVTSPAVPHISASFVSSLKKTSKRTSPDKKPCILSKANDWILLVDFDNSLTFPPCTGVVTNQRPDVIIYSLSTKHLIWAELTVPQERRIQEAALLKKARYSDLKTLAQIKDWIVDDYTVEVGALGFISHSFRRFLSSIGIVSPQLKFVLNRISTAARRSSFYLWNARYAREWIAPTLYNNPMQDPRKPVRVSPERHAPVPTVSPALVSPRSTRMEMWSP